MKIEFGTRNETDSIVHKHCITSYFSLHEQTNVSNSNAVAVIPKRSWADQCHKQYERKDVTRTQLNEMKHEKYK